MELAADFAVAQRVCSEHEIAIEDIQTVTGSFGKKIFFINQAYLLRVAKTPMTSEQEKFRRVAALEFVPKILQTGAIQGENGTIYYTLLTLLPGDDFVNAYPATTEAQQKQLGEDVARFLDGLQSIKGAHYDIGLYEPALPGFAGTWREGHQMYWDRLEQATEKLALQPDSRAVFNSAFRFLRSASAALDYQTGPKLLHNDFHPKNLLLDNGKFSGVIDWECSQFGEADFELCHLIHWCLYPPKPDIDFRTFLRALLKAAPQCAQAPRLAQRLTIYQIEHEIQQIVWNASQAESWRVPRLIRWMEGAVEDLLGEIAAER